MGKKSFYKKQLRPFVKRHRMALATIAGALGASIISAILGTKKAKHAVATLQRGVKDLTNKATNGLKRETAFSQS